MATSTPSFSIGPLAVHGDLILAPMDGFSDLPFRSICRAHGSAISYTAFVGAIELLAGVADAWHELRYLPQERPVVFQLFDSDETRLLEAAQQVIRLEPDAIDINMGCSVRRVSGRGAGAGLLRDPAKIERILRSLVGALPVPVTAKIRLGWDENERNYMQVARAIEASGAALLAVHGRTRSQAYSGRADWDAIAQIKAGVGIPVIGNGDVRSLADIDRMRTHTGCDGVMIGRGAMGNPWIFQRRERASVAVDELARVIDLHLERMFSFHGIEAGLLRFRKHLKRYLQPEGLSEQAMLAILRTRDPQQLIELLNQAGIPCAHPAPAPGGEVPVSAPG